MELSARCAPQPLVSTEICGTCQVWEPLPVPGSEFVLPVDDVILALGTTPNPLLTGAGAGLATTRKGCLVADERTGLTSRPRVYAGGDAVTGAATVILAAGAGKRAAEAIHDGMKS